MEEDNDIVDNTLNVMSDSISTFDQTFNKVPIYKGGHNLGAAISSFIDRIVDSIPLGGRNVD